MDVEKFHLQLTYKGKSFSAYCEKFQMVNYPQVWVVVGKFPKQDFYTFYLLLDKIFWFELPITSEPIARSIAEQLSKKFNLTFPTRRGTKILL